MPHAGRQAAQRSEPFGFIQPRRHLLLFLEQDAFDGGQEVLRVDRLAQVGLRGDGRRLRAPIRGNRHHGDEPQLRVVLLNRSELPAIHHGHSQIEHDDVGEAFGVQPPQRLASVFGERDVVAFLLQERPQGVANDFFVFNNEDTAFGGGGGGGAASLNEKRSAPLGLAPAFSRGEQLPLRPLRLPGAPRRHPQGGPCRRALPGASGILPKARGDDSPPRPRR